MKIQKKKEARKLRSKGLSINEIYRKLEVSKGSVSKWVRDIELTKSQKRRLSKKGHSIEVIEKRRKSRLENEEKKRQKIINKAYSEVKTITKNNLFIAGVSLYWAEGSKSIRGNVEFSNSDPKLIEIMMEFFKKVCDVEPKKFRGHVYLHPHLSVEKAERYWSRVSGIPGSQFFKTSQQQSRASKGKKDSLPYGTFSINIGSVELFLKIKGWMNAIYDKSIK